MIEPDVPLAAPWAAVSVVLWASYKVTEAVPTPVEKLTEPGYAGAVPFGEFDGPEKVIACEPVYAMTVFPAAVLRGQGRPRTRRPRWRCAGALTMNRASAPELTVTGVAALTDVHDCQIAVTV